ncbi:MAG: DNA methyltransferase [Candidatus Aenigmatarchaeota archaeon]
MEYEEFRKQLTHKVEEKPEWRELATFVPNKHLPVYNWFYYKEGFAKELVDKLIEMFEIKEGMIVLDPFCGSGTTPVACNQRGISAVGLDVLPTAVFASRVKTAEYSAENLREEAKILFRRKFHRLIWEFPKIMRTMINKYALEDIAFFSTVIETLKNKDFFTLALLNSAIKVSYAWKDGGVIKIKKHPVPPLRKLFQRTVYRMIKDVENNETGGTVLIDQCDAREMRLENNSIDAIITSPPYLNNIDYTKLYAIEDFFMKMMHVPSLRSFLGVREGKDQKKAYFEDMEQILKEMYRVCKPGAKVAMVVGNAYLRGSQGFHQDPEERTSSTDIDGEVECDFILSYLADKIGFETEKIFVLNKRFALENRTIKKGVLRESLIILKKK